MISFSVVRGFLRLCDGIENIDKLGNGRLQAAEHLCDEHFLGRDRRKFLNAVFIEILLLEIRALGHDLVRKGGRFLHRLRKDRRAAGFVGAEHGGRGSVEILVEIGYASPLPVTDQYTQLIHPEQSRPFRKRPSSSGAVMEPKPLPVYPGELGLPPQ